MNSDLLAQDAIGFPGVKRSGLICRYFLNNGDCFYGSNCQYSHEMPVPRPPGAVATADSQPQVTDEAGSYWMHCFSLHTFPLVAALTSNVLISLAVL